MLSRRDPDLTRRRQSGCVAKIRQGPHIPGVVFIGLDTMSQYTVVTTTPGKYSWLLMFRSCCIRHGIGFQCNTMMLPTHHLLYANIFRKGHNLGIRVTTTINLFVGGVTERGAFRKRLGVGKSELIGSDKVLTRFSITQLSIFRRARTVHVPV